jgi:hypothetical protein
MRTWYDRAVENGTLRNQGTDRDMNRFWGERISTALNGAGHSGWVKPSIESRALLEDTAGSGQAISPQAWNADFVDVLLPNTIVGEVGANRVAMEHETLK